MSPYHRPFEVAGSSVPNEVVELRPLRITVHDGTAADATSAAVAYQRLRTKRMREFGWRDLSSGEQDRDRYDDLGADTISVLLHTESGVLLGGLRLTRTQDPLASTLSAQMWPDSQAATDDQALQSRYSSGQLVDMTRLLISDEGVAEHILILLGACFASSEGRNGALFTISRRIHQFLRFARIPIEVLQTGEIGGEQCTFAMTPPTTDLTKTSRATRALLDHGARLSQPLNSFFTASPIVQTGSVHTRTKLDTRY